MQQIEPLLLFFSSLHSVAYDVKVNSKAEMNTLSTKMTSTFSDSKTFTNELQKKMTTNNVESVSPSTITADTSATPVNAGSLGKQEKKDVGESKEKFPIFLVFGLFVGVGSCLVVVGYVLYHGKQRKDKFSLFSFHVSTFSNRSDWVFERFTFQKSIFSYSSTDYSKLKLIAPMH